MTLSYATPTQDQLLDALTGLELHLLEPVRAVANGCDTLGQAEATV